MKGKYKPKSVMHAKLSFHDGFAERPFYTSKCKTTEKNKGIHMITLIMQNFNISEAELKEKSQEEIDNMIEEVKKFHRKPLQLHRDDKGRLSSPFASKKKII